MLWKLVPEDVIGTDAESYSTDCVREWRSLKNIMDKASLKPWTEFQFSPRTLQLRDYALRELWRIFVDDRPFCRNACFRHANVQTRAVLSNATTVVDVIYGWEEEEKRVHSDFAGCVWIHTKEALTNWQMFNPEMEEYLKERLMSNMICMNWVCVGT